MFKASQCCSSPLFLYLPKNKNRWGFVTSTLLIRANKRDSAYEHSFASLSTKPHHFILCHWFLTRWTWPPIKGTPSRSMGWSQLDVTNWISDSFWESEFNKTCTTYFHLAELTFTYFFIIFFYYKSHNWGIVGATSGIFSRYIWTAKNADSRAAWQGKKCVSLHGLSVHFLPSSRVAKESQCKTLPYLEIFRVLNKNDDHLLDPLLKPKVTRQLKFMESDDKYFPEFKEENDKLVRNHSSSTIDIATISWSQCFCCQRSLYDNNLVLSAPVLGSFAQSSMSTLWAWKASGGRWNSCSPY